MLLFLSQFKNVKLGGGEWGDNSRLPSLIKAKSQHLYITYDIVRYMVTIHVPEELKTRLGNLRKYKRETYGDIIDRLIRSFKISQSAPVEDIQIKNVQLD